jgi:rhamnosyltransferase
MSNPVEWLSTVPVRVGVVVVTYHPEGAFEDRFARMAAQGRMLVVVDNGSSEAVRERLNAWCARTGNGLIANAENRGIGAALNLGVSWLAAAECGWALLFDQDSVPAADMSLRMIETLRNHPHFEYVAVVGANFREVSTGRRHRILRRSPHFPGVFQKVVPGGEDMLGVTMVITSGSMVRVAEFDELGRFDEGFFIDYVDTDYCLRCLERGRLITVSSAAQFDHEFGQRTVRRWCGMKCHPTNHSALRHYYIARNRLPMWRRHAWRHPHWAMFDLATTGLWLFRVIAVEKGKWKKLQAMMLGTWDGIRGRKGPCPESRRRFLSA